MKKKRFRYQVIAFLLLFSLLADTTSASAKSSRSKKKEAQSPYSLNMMTANVLLDDSVTLTVDGITDQTVSFKSSSNDTVSVEPGEDGISCKCTGTGVGRATITVKIKEKGFLFFNNTATQLTCKINVTPKATSVQFNRQQIRMSPNTRKRVKITLRPSITAEIPVFSSSDPKIARVNAARKIVAKSPGIAVITATLQNGTTASCRVIVAEKTDSED